MALSADDVPSAIGRLGLSAEQRKEFARLTDGLRALSTQLADDASRLSLAQMKDRMVAIQGNCKACHDRFRISK